MARLCLHALLASDDRGGGAPVERFAPDRIVLLPLYPQFSTDHDGFVLRRLEDRRRTSRRRPAEIGCYPTEPGFVRASVDW